MDYSNFQASPMSPARWADIISASASAQPRQLKSVRATGAGTITVKTIDNPTAVVHDMLDGERLDLLITHVTAITGITKLMGYAD